MQWEFTCPKCRTTFTAEGPDSVQSVPCPTCGVLLSVPAQARSGALRARVSAAAPVKRKREINWIIWIAGGFAVLWMIVIAMLLILRDSSKPAPPVAAKPPAATPITQPAKQPLFDVNPPLASTAQSSPASAPAVAIKPPPPQLRIVPRAAAVTDEDVVQAIRKGIDFLLANVDEDAGEVKETIAPHPAMRNGLDALCVYALLHASQSMHDDRISPGSGLMRKMLTRLKAMPMVATADASAPVTYGRSLRAAALSVYDRTEDRSALRADVQWLLAAHYEGAYTYDDVYIRPNMPADSPTVVPEGAHAAAPLNWDNSNSQYGLLGVWCGAETGIPIPAQYWRDVARHWTTCQLADGTWGYRAGTGGSYFAMTVAGIAALAVTHDYLVLGGEIGGPERESAAGALRKAIEWLETADNSVNVGGMSFGYSLYGLERAALACGVLYPGRHDIYRELATQVLPRQLPSGAWGNPQSAFDQMVETSFHLLFLSRGRNAVMMNKLRYPGGLWDRHSRDLAGLSKYASDAMERPMNWQVVSLTQPWSAWLDAPILYIAGSDPPRLKESDYDKLRAYANNGGLIFTHADNGSEAFNKFAADLARRLFPDYEMSDIPLDDDLFTLQFVVTQAMPKMRAVSNGSRRLMIHSTGDIAKQWQLRPRRNRPGSNAPEDAALKFGVNLFSYATGKGDARARLDSPYVPAPSQPPARTIALARLQYAGNWNPEPAAWDRFERYFWWETGWDVQPRRVPISGLSFSQYPIAVLAGTTPDVPTESETKALRDFVNEGGVLIIDPAGGTSRFNLTIRKNWLPGIFPGDEVRVLSDDDPIITGKVAPQLSKAADDLSRVQVRRYTSQVVRPTNTRLLELIHGKGRVIISELDLTTGLLGTDAWGVNGYAPAYAQSLMKNILLWAASR